MIFVSFLSVILVRGVFAVSSSLVESEVIRSHEESPARSAKMGSFFVVNLRVSCELVLTIKRLGAGNVRAAVVLFTYPFENQIAWNLSDNRRVIRIRI
jgi:hypothetical protein